MSRSKGGSRGNSRGRSKQNNNRNSEHAETAHQKSMVYGYHAIKQLLESHPERVFEVSLQTGRKDERSQTLENLLHQHSIEIRRAHREELDAKFPDANHQGFVAEIKPAKVENESFLENLLVNIDSPFLVVLDQVQDPHNLGAILRSAAAAGVDAVIAPLRNACGLTGAVRKVAVGAAEIVPYVQVTNLARTLRFMQEHGVFVIGLDGEAEVDMYEAEHTGSLAIVMGNEAKGLRRLTREHCDQLIKIPMAGAIESLNVSVATGICVFNYAKLRAVN